MPKFGPKREKHENESGACRYPVQDQQRFKSSNQDFIFSHLLPKSLIRIDGIVHIVAKGKIHHAGCRTGIRGFFGIHENPSSVSGFILFLHNMQNIGLPAQNRRFQEKNPPARKSCSNASPRGGMFTNIKSIKFNNFKMLGSSTDPSRKDSTIFHSTIHGFKGLESSVVIITDIANLSDPDKMNILYVGMTRAKSALYLLINDKAFKCLP